MREIKSINRNTEMAGNKTRDGIKLSKLVRALNGIDGVTIRDGNNHVYVAYASGSTRPCPIATSTDARRMVVGWVKEVTGLTDSSQIYNSLRKGNWAYSTA